MRPFRFIKSFVLNCLKDEAGWVVLFLIFTWVTLTAGFILLSKH